MKFEQVTLVNNNFIDDATPGSLFSLGADIVSSNCVYDITASEWVGERVSCSE